MLWKILNWLRKKQHVRLASRAAELRRFRPFLEVLEQRELLSGSPPTVTSITPNSGPQSGGTMVTINGTNLNEVTGVDFGSTSAVNFSYNSTSNYITAVSPAESPGMIDIILLASGTGNSQQTSADEFTFTPSGGGGSGSGSGSASNSSVTSLSSSANPSTPGQAVTFTATVTGVGAGTPTGTVTFEDGSATLGSATLTTNSSGTQATFTTSSLAAGTHTITAIYNGDSNFQSSSASLTQTVGQVSPTDTFTSLTASADPAAPGQSVTFTATVSSTGGTPTGTVTFEDGSNVLGTGTLSSNISGAVATFTTSKLTTGFHSIIAVYGGSGPFTGSSSASLSEAVQLVSTNTSVSSSASPAAPGQSVMLTATVTGTNDGTPTGMVTFMDGTTVLGTGTLNAAAAGAQATLSTSGLALGSHTITAVYSGDSTFAGSTSASINETVQPVSTAIALLSSANPVGLGQSVKFTATVSGANGGTPTGTVTFEDGSTVLGIGTLSATSSGVQATFSTSSLIAGSHTITAFYGGDSVFAGSNASLSQVVGQSNLTSTSTSLFASTNQAAPGQSVAFTATVNAADGGTPTGTIQFLDGSIVLDTISLGSGGQAIFSTSSLALGMHTITAVYSGDDSYASSTSASTSATVQLVNSSISFSSSANPAAPGQSITLTATVSGADGGTPTGTVTFFDGSTTLGTATLSASSSGVQATLTTSSLATGTHSLLAKYGGDSTYAGSSSASLSQAVQLVTSSTSLTSSVDPALIGQSVTFTATVLGANGGTPTGAVTFMDGSTKLGTGTLSMASSGAQTTLTLSSLAVGANTITAVYGGDSTFTGSTSASTDESVQQIVSYTALTSSTPDAASGQSVTFTATVVGASGGTPTGTVSFEQGGTVLGTATLSAAGSGAQATFTTSSLADGVNVISAVYSGDSNFLGSNGSLSQSVGQTSTASSATSLSTSSTVAAPGQSVTFTVTVTSSSSGTPTGTVAFMVGSTLLGTGTLSAANSGAQATFTTANLANGIYFITAVYGGDGTFAGSSSVPLSQTVQQVGTSTSLTSSAASAATGQAVTFTAMVSGADGGTPTGTVTFRDGSTTLGTATLSAAGSGAQATFTTSSLANGTHSITAVYGGSNYYAGSSSVALSQIVQQMNSYSSLTSSANPANAGQSVTFTATVVGANGGTPTGTVTFKDGSTTLGTATLSAATAGAQATFTTSSLSGGAHSITAVYGGDSGYTSSTSAAVNETVQLLESITSVSTSADFTTAGQSVTFTVSVAGVGITVGTPTGTVTFMNGTTVLGTATLSAGPSGMPGAQATLKTSGLTAGWHSITAVYGGDSTFSGSSGSLSQVVGQSTAASTSTTLSSSATTVAPGQTVTFKATVTGNGGTPTGTVTFLDGTTVLGTASLSPPALGASGPQATFTTSSLASETHTITAVYGGDASFAGSASAGIGQTIGLTVTSTSLSSSADSLTTGQSVTYTATVSGNGDGAPTGTVTFLDGSTVLGKATLSSGMAGAEASFTTSALAAGSHFITAVYSGDSTYAGSSSASLSQTVQQAGSSVSLSASANPATTGQAVTLTATVSGSDGGTLTGTVTFMDGGTTLGTATLSSTTSGAQAVFTTSSLATGTHSLTAVYGGDGTFAPSTSPSLSETVQKTGSYVLLASSASPAATGQPVTFTATVSGVGGGTPTGTVTFEDGSTVLGTATLSSAPSGAQATFTTSALASGTHVITAVYSGDSAYSGSSVSMPQEIGQGYYAPGSTVSLHFMPGQQGAVAGQPLTFVASVSGFGGGSTPTGTVIFEDGSTAIGTVVVSSSGSSGTQATFTTSALAVGNHTITAIYTGDGTYSGSTSSGMTVTVQQAASSTSLTASADMVAPGDALTLTAAVSGNGDGIPTGTVTFMDGSTLLGTVSLNSNIAGSQATFTTSSLTTGKHSLTAVYNGDNAYASSTSGSVSETVQQDSSYISLAASANYVAPGQSVIFTATVSSADGSTSDTPTGTVTFKDGSHILGTASLASDTTGAEATFTLSSLALGNHSIAAVYSGNNVFTSVTSDTLSETVQQDISSTSLSTSSSSPTAGQAMTLTATVSGTYTNGTPTGTVTFMDGSTVLGTTTLHAEISGAQATFTTAALAQGSHTITAVYNGDAAFTGSTSASVSESVGPEDTTTTLSTSSASIASGQSVTFTATVNGANGSTPTGTVTFLDGSTILGTGTLSAGASGMQATYTTSALTNGNHSIAAIYSGDSNNDGSSDSLSQIVGSSAATQSSITLTSSASSVAPGQLVTFTATVSGVNGGTPTGTVTFLDGSTILGTGTLSTNIAGMQATFTTSSLAAGTHSITAVYGGDSTFAPSTSPNTSQAIQKVGSSLTLSSSADPATLGQSITLTATVNGDDGGTPTGTVTFMDGSTVLGIGTLSTATPGAQATFTTANLAAGDHSLIAVYSGDSTYTGSSSATLSQPVQLDTTYVTLTSSTNTPALGQAVTFTATVSGASGGKPTGTVTFLDSSTVLGIATLNAGSSNSVATFTTSALATGAHSITAVYSGDSTFAGCPSAVMSETVQQVFSYTAISSSAPAAASGQSVTFTATVIGTNGGTPTGTITFEDGSTTLGTITLSAATTGAQATYTTSTLTAGTHVITASYSGDSAFVASSASLSQAVGQTSPTSTTTSLSSSATPAAPGQSVTFTATVTSSGSGTPSGTVTFMDGNTLLGTATLSAASSGAQATFTTANLANSTHSLTAVYGGDGTFASSSSSALSQTVQQISTSVSLAASAAPAATGQSVIFTATVSGSTGDTPTGTVTFKDGSITLGTATLSAATSGAVAVLTTSSLANGAHSITAVYGGDSQNLSSTSAALSETVQQMSSTVSLSASDVLIPVGQSVTFTATVVGASGGTPTGAVTFKDGGTTLGTATLSATNSGMQAAFTTSTLAAGAHSITAVYGGDSGYTGNTSTVMNETVQLYSSLTSLSTSADSIIAGQSVTITATVVGVGAGVRLPTGTVTFKDGSTTLGTATLSGTNSGMQATFTTSSLAAGAHTITAVYGGDSAFTGSSSPALTETVAVDSTTITLTSSAIAALPGQSVTFTATVSGADGGTPTGTVTFMDGSTTLGTGTLSAASSGGAWATFTTSALANGTHSITSVYNGNSNYTGSTSTALSELVEQVGSFALLSSSANPATSGQAVTFTATISGTAGRTPTGSVTFKDGSTTLGTATLSAISSNATDLWSAQATFTTSSLATGAHTIQVTYGGDGGYLSSSASLIQSVSSSTSTQSTTTLSASATAALPSQSVTFTATVTVSGGDTPTGTVTFMDGSTVLGTATLSAASPGAQATLTTSALANGTHIITAVYNGDSTYAASTSTALVEAIQPASSTTTTLSSSTTTSAPGQAVTFTATVSSSGSSQPTGSISFQDGSTVLGTVTLSPGLNDMPGTVTAQATFKTSGLTLGSHSITAVYSGANIFTASASTAQSLTVQQNSSSISLSSSNVSTQSGQSVTFTATVLGSSGATPTGTITFQDGTTVLGIAVLQATTSGAQASFTTSALKIDSHSITATYGGDNRFTGSVSASLTQTVVQDSTTTALSSSAPSATSGQSVTFTATVTGPDGGTPTGTVTFMDGNTVLGTGTLSAASSGAKATFITSTLASGAHFITAAYGGDSTFAASTSSNLNQMMSDGTTLSTSTTLTSSNLQAAPGQVVTFTATVTGVDGGTPTGTVSFEDGSTVLGSAALSATSSGAQATFNTSALAAGSHSITAVYSGDTNYSSSTSPALTEKIQTGSSSSTGSGSSSPNTGSTGSSVTSSASSNVNNLFDSETSAANGVSTQLSSVAAAAAAASAVTATTTQTSSGNNAATPPQGPLDSSSSNPNTSSGSFQKHYTEWGSNSSASFYLDVTQSSTFSSSGETGTITYTAFLEENGTNVVDDQDVVVPFSYSTIIADGTTLSNLPTSGEIAGYGLSNLGFSFFTWDQVHYRETDSYDVSGTYTGANGVSYSYSQNSSTSSSWDSTRAATSSTAAYTNQYGDTWSNDFSSSDVAANFSGDTQYNANGYPTNLFAAPASGTTFFASFFDTGADSGLSVTTDSVVSGQEASLSSSWWFSTYNGISGSRYYYSNTATVPGSSSGNSDTVTWDINQQSTSSYGGSQDGNLNYNGSSPSGSVTTTSKSGSQSTSNSAMTDAYQVSGGGIQGSGLYKTSGSLILSANSQATEAQNYLAGSLTSDIASYVDGSNGSSSQTASNSDEYTITFPLGTTTGSDFNFSNSASQFQSNASGSLDLVANTSSINSGSSVYSTGSTIAFSTASFTASGDSASSSNTSLLDTEGNTYNNSTIVGGFDAAGMQTSGTSYDFSGDSGSVATFRSSQYSAQDCPTSTFKQTATGNYDDNVTTVLVANSDGSSNGSYQSNSSSATTTNTINTLIGTQKLYDGTAVYNDQAYSTEVETITSTANLNLASGQVNGITMQIIDDNNSGNYQINVQTDLNNDVLHSTVSGGGSGSLQTDETDIGTYADSTPTISSTIVFNQNGTSYNNVSARGNLSDGAGHSGNWTFTSLATASANNKMTIYMTQVGNSGWKTTGLWFFINESSNSTDAYHEQDNGLGAFLLPGETASFHNTVDATANASQSFIETGTLNSASFSLNQSSNQTLNSSSNTVASIPILSISWNSSSSSSTVSVFLLNESGTQTSGQLTLSNVNLYQSVVSQGQQDGSSSFPLGESTSHVRWLNSYTLQMSGNSTSGTGQSQTSIWQAAWGTTTFLGISTSWGNSSGGTYTPPPVNLSWGPNLTSSTYSNLLNILPGGGLLQLGALFSAGGTGFLAPLILLSSSSSWGSSFNSWGSSSNSWDSSSNSWGSFRPSYNSSSSSSGSSASSASSWGSSGSGSCNECKDVGVVPPGVVPMPGGPSDVPKQLKGRWAVSLCVSGDHAWIEYVNVDTGEKHTAGRYMHGAGGGVNPDGTPLPPASVSGVQWDRELSQNRTPTAKRTVIIDDPVIYGGFGYNAYSNNCATYARDTWLKYTGEWYWLGLFWDNPSSLLSGVQNQNNKGK